MKWYKLSMHVGFADRIEPKVPTVPQLCNALYPVFKHRNSLIEEITFSDVTLIRRKLRLKFAWYDMWVGAFYDRRDKVLYICPVPMIVLEIPIR